MWIVSCAQYYYYYVILYLGLDKRDLTIFIQTSSRRDVYNISVYKKVFPRNRDFFSCAVNLPLVHVYNHNNYNLLAS